MIDSFYFPFRGRRLLLHGAALGLVLFTGCTSSEITVPSRSAIEQLLLSTAADNALKGVELPQLAGEKVFLEEKYIESYDEPYVIGSIRALLSENGALLQPSREEADLIVEARVGALGVDSADSLVGIPSLPLPIPAVGTVETPQAALYASRKKDSVAKIALLGYRKDGTGVFSTEPISGKAKFHEYELLLMLNINFTDIPEREDY